MKTLGPCDVGSFVAQSHTPCNRCVRFATTVASGHATLATKRTLLLTWAGLPPAGSHQLCLAHVARAGYVCAGPCRFTSSILPKRVRRTKSLDALFHTRLVST